MLVTKFIASKRIAWSALFLLEFFTVFVPERMFLMATSCAFSSAGSSGVGKYCKIFMHFT